MSGQSMTTKKKLLNWRANFFNSSRDGDDKTVSGGGGPFQGVIDGNAIKAKHGLVQRIPAFAIERAAKKTQRSWTVDRSTGLSTPEILLRSPGLLVNKSRLFRPSMSKR